MSQFGNFALNLLGTVVTQAMTGSTGYYNTGAYNNCIFDQANGCCNNGIAAETQASNRRVSWGVIGGIAGFAAIAGGTWALIKNGQDKQEVQQRISTLNQEINAELAKVGNGTTAANYETKISENKKVIADYTATDKAVKERTEKISKVSAEVTAFGNIADAAQREMDTQQAIITSAGNTYTAEQKLEAQNAYDVAEAKKKKALEDQGKKQAELEKLELDQGTDNQKLTGLKTKYDALSVKTAEEFDKIGASIKTKLEELKGLEAEHLENADGNEFNRKASKNFGNLFVDNSNDVKDEVIVSKRDIREAINQYRSTTGEAQKTAFERLQKLWAKADEDITGNTTLNTAYEIIKKQQANLG